MTKSLAIKLSNDHVAIENDLRISFRRTVRVPDNQQASYLPPDLGKFPLQPVSQYVGKLPADMSAKAGLFFPMYQSEAMWINFSCSSSLAYMIKIYVGGVNAISGEPAIEDAGTRLRRQAKVADKSTRNFGAASPLQDYIVVPAQHWLDGIAAAGGSVRQFVAMPFGSGYPVESQVTGKDAAGGIQFEITPCKPPYTPPTLKIPDGEHRLFIKAMTGKIISLSVDLNETVETVMTRIYQKEGIPCDQQRLVFNAMNLEPHRCLSDNHYNIHSGSTLHLVLRLRGGATMPHHEMSVAAGGKIKQAIVADLKERDWQPQRTTVFNVQILNSAVYHAVTGRAPPTQVMTADDYAQHGFPFFKLYEEPSTIHGNFDAVKSVAQIDGDEDVHVKPPTVAIGDGPVGLANPAGPLREFRTVEDLKKQLGSVHIAEF